mgnify:CR=1 FL=1
MLEISKPHSALLVSAINDAIKYNEWFLESETIQDVSDYEEHLLCLENFQNWIETEYKKLELENPDILKYDEIVGKIDTK